MLQGDYWMNIKHDYYIKKLSISEIARTYGIDRKTVRRYLKDTDKPKYTYKKPRHKVIEDYADFINEKLKEAPYSAVRIKELLEEHFNIKICYTSVQQYVRKEKTELSRNATVRFETLPGEQGQVDCGFFETHQNDIAIKIVKIFAKKNNYKYGSTLKIASGEGTPTTIFKYLLFRQIKKFAKSVSNQQYKEFKYTMPISKNELNPI